MRKTICFGGFSESEARPLQLAFADVSTAWDWVFAADAAGVLAQLATSPVAALLVDVRMGDRAGADVLHQAAVDCPQTLRFAVGDVADRELVANSIGATYQFISRPWKASELIDVIERSLAFDAWLSTDQLRAFVPQLGRLPSLPSSYFEVLKRVESPSATVQSVAEVVARDPALTARLLQTVNSAASGLTEKITSPVDAVSALGLDVVKSLVLCLQVFNQLPTGKAAILSLDALWRQSLAVAQLARHIALLQTPEPRLASDAYAAGLLHRIGQIVLATNLADAYGPIVAEARKKEHRLHDVELRRLGVTSNQVGGYLLGLWGMPLTVAEAVALYPAPSQSSAREFSLVTAVHVADVLASEDGAAAVEGLPQTILDTRHLAELNLPVNVDAWRKLLNGEPAEPAQTERGLAPRAPAVARGMTETPDGVRRSRRTAMIGSLLSLGIAVPVIQWQFGRSTPLPADAQTAATSAKALPNGTTVSTNAAARAESGFDSVKLQGIFYRADRPAALINGRTLCAGESFNGISVVSIKPTAVVLQIGTEQKTFKAK